MKKRKINNHLKKVSYTILIAFAIILFWRGIWGLMDAHLFPKNHTLSYIISIIVGIIILYKTETLVGKLI